MFVFWEAPFGFLGSDVDILEILLDFDAYGVGFIRMAGSCVLVASEQCRSLRQCKVG